MRLLDRYLFAQVFIAIVGTLLVLLALDTIAELVDQSEKVVGDYHMGEALIYTLLKLPGSLNDYLGFSALIGCLIGLGAMANSSELTVMRASGISTLRVGWMVMKPALVVILFGVLVSEFFAPRLDQMAESRRNVLLGREAVSVKIRESGLWMRDGKEFVHVNAVYPGGVLYGVARYTVNEGQLIRTGYSLKASYQGDGWVEERGDYSELSDTKIHSMSFLTQPWKTELSPELLNMSVLQPQQLSIRELKDYTEYLGNKDERVREYRVLFWQKLLAPLSVASLVFIGMSFVLGSMRQVSVAHRVFVGVIVGVSVRLLQDVFGPASIIWGVPALLAVAIPILLTSLVGIYLIWRKR